MTETAKHKTNLCSELAGIQGLLLRPEPSAMHEIESRLEGVIAGIRESKTTEFGSGVRNSVSNIRFLLESALQFWDKRRVVLTPCLQYSAHGALVEHPSQSTFQLEV